MFRRMIASVSKELPVNDSSFELHDGRDAIVPGPYTPPSHPMMTELVIVNVVGIFTIGIMFINL